MLTTIDETMAAFLAYAPPGMAGHYQLEGMRSLLKHLGNPQETLRVIHVAGTSGKTSTAYFIRGLLEAAGQRTGLTVSPHITSINERVQIGGAPLAEPQFVAYTNEFLGLVAQTDLQPTYFELLVAMAYWIFAKERVDYAVIETGLGGLMDGTNTVTRPDKLCVITDIGLDHTEILGDTVAEIAAQKAGIIQPGNHVFVRRQDDTIMRVISETVEAQNALLTVVPDDDMLPAILPLFQRHNWRLACAVLQHVQEHDGVSALTPKQLETVALQTPPGRWELHRRGDKTIILDGAHNPQKLQALYESLQAKHLTSAAVLANLIEAPDAKMRQSADILQAFTAHLIIPEFNSGQDLKSRRSLPATTFAALAQESGIKSTQIEPDALTALDVLLARPEKTLVITGSLYLVSAVRSAFLLSGK